MMVSILLAAVFLSPAANDGLKSVVPSGDMRDWGIGEWPVLREYDGEHLYRIALPVGGIGTGTISLGGRGELRDWELMNTPAKGFTGVETGNDAPFLAIRAEGGGRGFSSILEGPAPGPSPARR